MSERTERIACFDQCSVGVPDVKMSNADEDALAMCINKGKMGVMSMR